MQAYVYKVTLPATGQFYVGFRCANVRKNRTPEDDIWVKYHTSSAKVRKLLQQFPKEQWVVEILFKSDDPTEAWVFEQNAIIQDWSSDLLINDHYTNPSTCTRVFSSAGIPKTAEHKRKLSESNKGKHSDPEKRRRASEAQKGKTLSEEHKAKLSTILKQRVMSDEHRQKISLALKGKKHDQERVRKRRTLSSLSD